MRVAIITGGESGEREISMRSAENVVNLIDFADTEVFVFPEEKERFLNVSKNFDVAIPVIHGVGGEDGALQGFLKEIKVPYIFSDSGAHAVGIDKKTTKQIAKSIGIKIAPETSKFPLFAKPNLGGSSVDSGLCRSQEELDKLISANSETEFILEEPINGREFTVGIIEHNQKIIALPVIEIIPKGEFFDFENKYNPKSLATEICPADIDESLNRELQKQALAIHKKINAKHISRSDFIVRHENEIYFLEINTIPGMTRTSLIPKMLNQAKISLVALLKEWIKQCISN